MLDKLEGIKARWQDIEMKLSSPDVVSDMIRFKSLNKEYKDLHAIVVAYDSYVNVLSNYDYSKEILHNEKDEEMKAFAKEELEILEAQKIALEESIRLLMIPQDPEDARNAIIEIRGGSGGDEASIFAGDLYRMYLRFCEKQKWKVSTVDFTDGTAGGYKEVVMEVEGENAYGILKYESGVHRVQRVPQTETQGRVHTSAASVAILPEADEFQVNIKQTDIRKDTFCSSGAGGQSVNTTYSAVRLTHMPTGIVVSCQDERSQIKNTEKAMGVLRSRIYEIEYNKKMAEIAKKRKTMVSTGDRSAKVRTYNYPQSRITDHRIGYTVYNLAAFMEGDILDLIESLQMAENAERLKAGDTI